MQLLVEYQKLGRDLILMPVETILSEEKETVVYDFINKNFSNFYTKDPYIIYVRRLNNMWCINNAGHKIEIKRINELFKLARL